MSVALAILLIGASALLTQILPFFNVRIHPLTEMLVLFNSGILMFWIGWRGSISMAEHAGLWLIASAWGQLYFFIGTDSDTFGLWLSLLAAFALLAERLLTSVRKQKRKMLYSIRETVVRWPLAYLIMGLSAM